MLLKSYSLKSLFNEYIDKSKIPLNDISRVYLLDLLEKYGHNNINKDEDLAFIELLLQETTNIFEKLSNLKAVGDTCLIYSGLYPEYLTRRTTNLDYYFSLGQTAYIELYYNYKELRNSKSFIFKELHKSFKNMVEVLHYVKKRIISNRKSKIHGTLSITGI